MVVAYLQEVRGSEAARMFDKLLLDKLSDALDEAQKREIHHESSSGDAPGGIIHPVRSEARKTVGQVANCD